MTHYSTSDWLQCFQEISKILGHTPNKTQQEKLQQFTNHLLTWNQTYNLIGPAAVSTLLTRHILNSITLLPHLTHEPPTESTTITKIADMGSGAGFPGIILAILSTPSKQFYLYEASQKKTRFLNFITAQLQLTQQVTTCCQQIEQVTKTIHANTFDFVTTRALGDLQLIAKLSRKLLKPNGIFLALKGQNIHNELNQFMRSTEAKYFNTPSILNPSENGEGVIIQLQSVSRETGAKP